MSIKIDTAVSSSNDVMLQLVHDVSGESTYSARKLYPNNEQTYYFVVQPGTATILTAYSLVSLEDYISVNKVLLASGSDQVGGGACCDVIKKAVPNQIISRAEVCAWRLEICKPMTIIKTPGVYEISPAIDDTEAVVTIETYPLQDFNNELNYST